MTMRACLVGALLLAGCTAPPPEAYVSGAAGGASPDSVELGSNQVGEACVQAAGRTAGARVYCGTWQQPSARVRAGGAATEATLGALATAGPWRTGLDANYLCPAPQPMTLDGMPAMRMVCTGKAGGWPHLALVALSGGQAWLADGVTSAEPVVGRSIAILSGRARGTVITNTALQALQAERRGTAARATGDVREYDALMQQGARANLADNPAAAESAYGAALALEEKAFGRDNPNVADPAMHLALQLSNQGRFLEAEALFKRAERLAAQQQGDVTLRPRLLHYEGLHEFNQHHDEAALALLRRADAGYLAVLPADALRPPPRSRDSIEASLEAATATPLERQLRAAVAGLVEARRYQGVVLRGMGRRDESEAMLHLAATVAQDAGLGRPELTARLDRAEGVSASQAGNEPVALSAFENSSRSFLRAYPSSRPQALVLLLQARELVRAGQAEAAVPVCRNAMAILQEIKSAFQPGPMSGCLDSFAGAAAETRDPARAEALRREMFLASQLVQGSTTSQQIQQASARLAGSSANPKLGEAIREQQDAAARVAGVLRRRQDLLDSGAPVTAAARTALDQEEGEARAGLATQESRLQEAAPNYDQLIQQAVSADTVLATLRPGEAFVAITLSDEAGYVFLLRDGAVSVGRLHGGARAIDPLVLRVRSAMEPTLPAFDTQAAEALFDDVFGDVAPKLDGVTALTVAPSGSLLSLPFGVMLTGHGDPARLGAAPWLARRMAIGHVPSAANFTALRKVSGGSRASRPWFGFGDFHPVTLAQARRTFPANCGDSATLLAHLPPLPSATVELSKARELLGGSAGDELLGSAFTARAVETRALSDYRVLHFATHAILPSELRCQNEPALVASAPAGAADASGALLTASDLAQIKLDADLVILSACNSGGPNGTLGGGESLSTLARSFFFGGARALLITHWEVSDSAATFIVADTLRRMRADPGLGVAAALQQAQGVMLERAGNGLPAEFSHPFFWAPFALVGQAAAPKAGTPVAGSVRGPAAL